MKLGMDIMGRLPMVSAHKRFMLALTDYYSKWIAAEAYAGIKDKDVWMFFWKHIIYQFTIPNEIVVDNSSQLISNEFLEFYEYWRIKLSFSTPQYP